MMMTEGDPIESLPEPVRAEAAVWLARLHCDLRSADTERAFRAWFAASPLHAAAFERMTNTWEATRALDLTDEAPEPRVTAFLRRPVRKTVWVVAFSIVALVIAGALFWPPTQPWRGQLVQTDFGERRSLSLPDGSRLVLNTDSRVFVQYQASERRLTLEKGQARFEVAHAANRPFIVEAGGKEIIATGTAFDVSYTSSNDVAVVLFEGRVTVSPSAASDASAPAVPVILEPGERAQFDRAAVTIRAVTKLDREEAWLGGRAVFEGTPLRDAIAEMNRYTRRRLEYSDPAIGRWRISGTFSVDDIDAFARSLVDLFPVSAEFSNQRIVLRPTNDSVR
jgi:transmembrane sensor